MGCIRDLFLPASGDYAQTSALLSDGGNGPPIDLTGATVSIIDVTGSLIGAVSVAIVDAVAGLLRLTVVWQGGWPIVAAHLGTFRLRIEAGQTETVTEPVAVFVAGPTLTLTINRGSDMVLPLTWPDDRAGASLAGEVVDVVNADGALAGLAGVEVLDAATRACRLTIAGDPGVALGPAGSFQLRRSIAGSSPRTLPPIAVTFR